MQNRIYWRDTDLSRVPQKRLAERPTASVIPLTAEAPEPQATSNKTYIFRISSNREDRAGDVIEQGGWNLREFNRNPVVLFAHNAGYLPVGRATKVYREGDHLVAEMKFSSDAFAQRVRRQVDEGSLRATSVGFRPGKWEFMKGSFTSMRFIEGHELMEFSVVPVPANPDAVLVGIGKNAEEARQDSRQRYVQELTASVAEIKARGRELDKRDEPIKQTEKVSPELEKIRVRRAERQRIAAMGPAEFSRYLDQKAARKEERQATLERIRAGGRP